ncbi:MAG: hypothetical protein V1857_04135 [archaeon]
MREKRILGSEYQELMFIQRGKRGLGRDGLGGGTTRCRHKGRETGKPTEGPTDTNARDTVELRGGKKTGNAAHLSRQLNQRGFARVSTLRARWNPIIVAVTMARVRVRLGESLRGIQYRPVEHGSIDQSRDST